MKEDIVKKSVAYRKELDAELRSILHFWMQYSIDEEHGGFCGKIDQDNNVFKEAPKGSVLNSRILWAFSAAYHQTNDPAYLQMADRAYHYIVNHFIDPAYGGVYWSVDYKGAPLDPKKQIYAQAFAIYGLSQYVKASEHEEAKRHAIQLYETIEKWSHDTLHGGYIEALARD